ncbi:MAG: DUF4147 domain-containing protein [Planctomycetota bacterium]
MPTPSFDDHRGHTAELTRAALDAADPAAAIEAHWPDELRSASRVTLLSVGKASVSMARRAISLLGDGLRQGVVLAPPSHAESAAAAFGDRLEVLATDHPLPTPRNESAARRVATLVQNLGHEDTLLVLISGGASAQLSLPRDGVTIDDLSALTHHLLRAGAAINELNTVRKHLERLKGGGIVAITGAARTRSLIVSDVVGNDPATVSSGPTSPDPTTFADAIEVVDRYEARRVAPNATACLLAGVRGAEPETPKPGEVAFERGACRVVASNEQMIDAVATRLVSMGFELVERRTGVQGEAEVVGRDLGRRAAALLGASKRPAAILLGGETTVTVGAASGVGGRNQELATAAALEIHARGPICVMSLATDGIDGPTNAAGAVVTSLTAGQARALGVRADAALRSHDTHPLLDRLNALIRTGPTGVNVIDLMLALVYPTSE